MDCIAGILLFCCQSTPDFSFEDWNWVAIDPHVHSSLGSNDTDGLGTPETILPAMQRAKLDFVILTDHSNSFSRCPPPNLTQVLLDV